VRIGPKVALDGSSPRVEKQDWGCQAELIWKDKEIWFCGRREQTPRVRAVAWVNESPVEDPWLLS
jgi:hypothetical protein